MAFIGNTPISVAFLTDTFSGNGSTTAFTMTVAPANTSSIIVAITGVLQDPSTYSVSGTTLTFSAAPPTGTSNISVRYLGIPASGVTTTAYRTVTNFTATAGQTSFSVPSYTIGYIDVYRNGVRLVSTDYTATTGTTVVLNNACTVGDAVVTESFYVSSVLNAIPATAGAVNSTYLTDGAVTQAKLGTGVAGNGPAFSASVTGTTTITSGVFTKMVFNSENWDTASCFDSTTNYRFTPNVAGYYLITGSLDAGTSTAANRAIPVIYRNGSAYRIGVNLGTANGSTFGSGVSAQVYFNGTTDYVELFAYVLATTAQYTAGTATWFDGVLVRAA
jgi:hypothetical protein